MAAGAKIGIKVLSIVIAIPVGIAARKGVEAAWAATGDPDRPRKPAEENVEFADAVAWAALSAVGLVVTRLVTRRTAEATYRAITGNPPPPGKATDAEKKAEKAAKKAEKKREKAKA